MEFCYQEDAKKASRAQRFGIPKPVTAEEENAKKKARQDRFGILNEADKLSARAARFGGIAAAAAPAMAANGSAELEAKKKARAERFAVKS